MRGCGRGVGIVGKEGEWKERRKGWTISVAVVEIKQEQQMEEQNSCSWRNASSRMEQGEEEYGKGPGDKLPGPILPPTICDRYTGERIPERAVGEPPPIAWMREEASKQ